MRWSRSSKKPAGVRGQTCGGDSFSVFSAGPPYGLLLRAPKRQQRRLIGFLSPSSTFGWTTSKAFSSGSGSLATSMAATSGLNPGGPMESSINSRSSLPNSCVWMSTCLVTSVTEASLQAKKATSTIPIVMVAVGDPVAVGLVASLARPGGNVTGTSSLSIDIVGKQIELLKAAVPGLSHAALLWNPANAAYQALQLREAERAARTAGLELQLVERAIGGRNPAVPVDSIKSGHAGACRSW